MEEILADLRIEEDVESGESELLEIEPEEISVEQSSTFCLVGCFLTATTINFQSMSLVMANLWHPIGGVSITDIGDKRIIFRFYCEVDRDKVIKGSPWTFNNHLLLISMLNEGEDPLEVSLNNASFWVQIYNLLSGLFSENTARQFGDFIGSYMEYDTKAITADNSTSDHCPIFLDTDCTENVYNSIGNRGFRFERTWLLEDSYNDEVKFLWDLNKHLKVPERLHTVGEGLRKWILRIKREKNGKINSLKQRLNILYNAPPNDVNLEEIIETKFNLNSEIDKSEIYWEQRAKSNWLKYGDRNTRFFHSLASNKHRMNKIMSIKRDDGSMISDEGEMMKTTEFNLESRLQ
ncbi:hypothetical protein GOBAR_AA34272 [Gossypium barbadense]|uniref:DUF4283 domain-containing protein n=1 Tax=Gossypium barbadense TaxID=3634 RepID=A0A2P5W5N6_GOSBA|nr:hypothetical protein GOBAR_AA34272 [Gossypium barbadense]